MPMMRAIVYILFLLSGATALVYEVAWTRRLVLVLGGTTIAVSLILAAWMLGLALGAKLFGGIADRAKRPLLLYGVLEAGIALIAFVFPILLDAASGIAFATGGGRIAAFLLCFLVLLLPTTLMGGTLPILSRYVVRSLDGIGGRIGLLYGLNTVGAVAGTFLSGFVLIEAVGVFGSTRVAAAANVLIAAVAIALSRQERDAEGAEVAAGVEAPAGPGPERIALAAAFAAGFLSLASEVLWTRMLTFFLEGFTYAFSAMLTTFLFGLAIGALISGRLVNRIRNLRAYVGVLFLISALVSAAVLFALTENYAITKWAKATAYSFSEHWRTQYALSVFLVSFLMLFPPALVMGGIFPAVVKLATRRIGEVGSRVGLVYAVNTLGAVAGALVAGLALVPLFGMARSAAILATGAVVTAAVLLGRRGLVVCVPVAAATGLLVGLASPGTPFVMHSQVFQETKGFERELVSYEEGAYAAVSVVRERRNDVRAIYTDEFQAAATGPHYKYMRLLAHLPLLVAPKWEGAETLVICFGTGTTAGSAAEHPLGRLDVVEICPEVLDQADYFRDVNRDVLTREHDFPFAVHVDDGRSFLAGADRKWDVISLEPLMPYTPGAVNLYTEDFYRLGRERLAEGGVMCQWIPFHAVREQDYKMLVRSFTNVFPNSTLWFVEETSLIIGTTADGPIDYGRLLARIRAPGVREDLAGIGFDDPLLVLNTFVAGGGDLAEFTADAKTMSDEHPWLEFYPVPYGFPNTFVADNLAELRRIRRPVTSSLDLSSVGAADRKTIEETLARYYEAGQSFLEAQYFTAVAAFHGANRNHEEQSRYRRLAMEAFETSVKLNPDDASARYLRRNAIYGWRISTGYLHLDRKDYGAAEQEFAEAIALDNPFKPDLAWMLLGRTYNRMNRPGEALRALERALELFPESPDGLAERGYARFLMEDFRAASGDFDAAWSGAVKPESDSDLLRARKRVANMAEKGLFPAKRDREGEAAKLLVFLKDPRTPDRSKSLERLKEVYRVDPAAVRRALAGDMAGDTGDQSFALKVTAELGDLEATIELLSKGAPTVRARAADLLSYVREARKVVPALIEAMLDESRDVRCAALTSYFGVTGEKPGEYDPDAPEDKRRAEVEKLRTRWGD